MKKLLLLLFVGCNMAYAQSYVAITMDSLKTEKDAIRLKDKLERLTNSLSEEDVNLAVQYYGSTNQIAKGDSLAYAAAKRFPEGKYALVIALNKLSKETDPILQETLFAQLEKQFPSKAGSREFDSGILSIALNFAEQKNTAKALEHWSKIKGNSGVSLLANALLAYDPATAAKLLEQEIGKLKNAPELNSGTRGRNPKFQLYSNQALYGKALLKLGRPAEALEQAKAAFEGLRPTGANSVLITYAEALWYNKAYEASLPLYKQIVIEGSSDKELNAQLLAAYKSVYPKANAQQYLDSLRNILVQNVSKDIKRLEMRQQAPMFTVTDESGKTVSLEDMKGKVLIVDFWATWCAPCKASFPAMQLAVDKYKKDPNVMFLFIHTWERSKTPQKDAQTYLSANNYSFPLYMDVKNPATNSNPAVSSFGVEGIPTKFIIDGAGNIRFKLAGFYSGRDEASAAEVAAMIEICKNS